MEDLIIKLVPYGQAGINIIILLIVIYMFRAFVELQKNHFNHLIDTFNCLIDSINKNTEIVDKMREIISGCRYNRK